MRTFQPALAAALGLVVVLAVPHPAAAQESPRVVVGWETTKPDVSASHVIGERLDGWNAELLLPAAGGLDVVGDVEGVMGAKIRTGFVVAPNGSVRPAITAAGTGVRYTWMRGAKINPFAEGRVGVAAWKMAVNNVDVVAISTSTNLEESARVGADVRLWHRFGAEATAGYRAAHVFNRWMHRPEYGVGAVWWFK